MTLEEMKQRIVKKVLTRRFNSTSRIGWFDFSSDSYDMRMCEARAYRIQQRLVGVRITIRQALWGY